MDSRLIYLAGDTTQKMIVPRRWRCMSASRLYEVGPTPARSWRLPCLRQMMLDAGRDREAQQPMRVTRAACAVLIRIER